MQNLQLRKSSHPGRLTHLTWNLRMHPRKRNIIFQNIIFRKIIFQKWQPGIGDSFWKPSFLGSMLNFGRAVKVYTLEN